MSRTKGCGRSVIVAGLFLNGATVVRNLSRQGYDVWALSYDASEQGWRSRYGRKIRVPNPETDRDAWVDAMLSLSARFATPPPLIPTYDVFVVALDRAWPRLRGKFLAHGFGSGLRTALTSKRGTFELAEQQDFPRPMSRMVGDRESLSRFAAEVAGDVLIKPEFPSAWRAASAKAVVGDRKVITDSSLGTLLSAYDELAAITPNVLAQEVIPGPDSNLIYWCGFVGADGRVGGRLIGRKDRVTPIHFGSASFVRLLDLPSVEKQCEAFLVGLGYQGICGIELKVDERDGIAKLIEINPRYGLWDDIGIPVGVDLAREAVVSLLGEPTRARRASHFEQKWVSLRRDVPTAFDYAREGLLRAPDWVRTVWPPTLVNDLPWSDPLYAAATLRESAAALVRGVLRGSRLGFARAMARRLRRLAVALLHWPQRTANSRD